MDFWQELGLIGFSARLRRLNEQITQDVLSMYKQSGVSVDLRYLPILLLLKKKQTLISSELSEALGYTRAGVSQIIAAMLKDALLIETVNADDRRMKFLKLSPKGKDVVKWLTPVWQKAEKVFESLAEESGYDLLQFISTLETCLSKQKLLTRFNQLEEAP